MRLSSFAVVGVIVIFSVALFGQHPAPAPATDLTEIRSQLSETLRLLQQTRQELQDSQAQMKALRAEVDSIKATLAQPATAAQASPQVDQLAEAQALTDSRVEQIYQSKVESGSKYRVKLSGLILFNAGVNRGAVDNQDVPMAASRVQPGQSGGDINATMRQTVISVGVNGPDWLGARTSADVQFDFFGGFPDTLDGNALGLLRLRTGHAQLEWDKGSLMIGQDQPFISPLSPTSLATVGSPALGYSGNLWTWTPQIVASRKFGWSEHSSSTFQIGLLDPFSGEAPQQFTRQPEAGERSRVPAMAIRHAFTTDIAGRKFTLGTSGLYSRHSYGFGRNVNGYAATLDWLFPFTDRLELSGEFFRGRAIGGMWGAIGTSVVLDQSTGEVFPVNAIGGWTQLKFKPAEKWEVNSAFGIDNPFARDLGDYLAPGGYHPYARNATGMFNIMHHPRSNLVLSLEYRHLNTHGYYSHRYTAENINLGIGVHF